MGHYYSDFCCDTCGEYDSPCKCTVKESEKELKNWKKKAECSGCEHSHLKEGFHWRNYCDKCEVAINNLKAPDFCPKKSKISEAERLYKAMVYNSWGCNLDNKTVQNYVKELENKLKEK